MKTFWMTAFCLLLLAVAPTTAWAEDDLCPDLESEKKTTPQDMAGVQADIDRLTLCVERARLLKQLDDISDQRLVVLERVKNPQGASNSMGIPALPVGSLPPVRGLNDLKAGVNALVPTANPLDNALNTAMESLTAPEWKVRKIWGQGASMRAQLSDGQGTLVNVVKGDPLPDGGLVDAVTVKGVTISENGKTKELSWEQASSDTSASKANTDVNVSQTTP
jgi:type IV pilus biogenesis protein PilP